MRLLVLCAALAVAACSRPAEPPPAKKPAAVSEPAKPAEPAPRYVGRWATSVELCRDGAWVFEPDRLTTAGEVACEFRHVAPAPGGYDIDAMCTAEAPPAPYSLRLRFAESAGALLVEGGPFHDVGLIPCRGD
jgi:hypothetical protein